MRFKGNGFSLIELIFGVAILIIVASASLLVYVQCMLLNQASINLTRAANDAQYCLEQMRARSFSELATYSPPTFTNLPNEYIASPTIGSETSYRKRVTVNVTWTERGVAKIFSLTTYFAQ